MKDVPGYCRKVELKGDWKNVMRELLETTGANARIVVLGSGDPLFHGIGGALLREFFLMLREKRKNQPKGDKPWKQR